MDDVLIKCSVCGALLDEEDLFCVNCGTESPHRPTTKSDVMTSTHNFTCDGCGASMSYDASAQNLRCPFCGSEKMHADADAKTLAPEIVLPFSITADQAKETLAAWMKQGFWRPDDLAASAVITQLTPVYVPYWIFSANVHTYWTADTSHTPPGARAAWAPIGGEHEAHHEGVLVGASGILTPRETAELCPFDFEQGVSPEDVDLENVVYEQFRVQKKYARPQAIEGFEQLERAECRQFVPGNVRNLRVNVRLEGLTGHPILLPVFITAYQYRDQTYRFLLNGRTGKHTGTAPTSFKKIGLVAAAVVGVCIVAFVVVAVCSGLGAMMR